MDGSDTLEKAAAAIGDTGGAMFNEIALTLITENDFPWARIPHVLSIEATDDVLEPYESFSQTPAEQVDHLGLPCWGARTRLPVGVL
jgi:hypothetical protein